MCRLDWTLPSLNYRNHFSGNQLILSIIFILFKWNFSMNPNVRRMVCRWSVSFKLQLVLMSRNPKFAWWISAGWWAYVDKLFGFSLSFLSFAFFSLFLSLSLYIYIYLSLSIYLSPFVCNFPFFVCLEFRPRWTRRILGSRPRSPVSDQSSASRPISGWSCVFSWLILLSFTQNHVKNFVDMILSTLPDVLWWLKIIVLCIKTIQKAW